MSEAAILAAFWMPGQKRFAPLTGDEVTARSGTSLRSWEFVSLRSRRLILATYGSAVKMKLYQLAPEGERRVSAMIVMGTLPKSRSRLTAVPR